MQSQSQPHVTLDRTGDKMPLMGLGIWKIPNDICAETVYQAIKAGYRLIDSASDYGNEKEAGEGLQRAISEGLVKREEMFITSKLWNSNHRPEVVEAACKRSMDDFQVDYLDLYLIHFPIAIKYVDPKVRYPQSWKNEANEKMEQDFGVTYEQTWHAMEDLVTKNMCRNIGFSNIGCVKVTDVLKYCKIRPSVLQVELHPFLPQDKMCRYVQEQGIHITAYSSFGSLSYLELNMATEKDTCLLSPALLEPAKKYNKTATQVALRWATQRNHAVIPKSTKVARLVENFTIFDFELTADEMKAITALDCNKRYNDPGNYAEPAFGCFCPIFE